MNTKTTEKALDELKELLGPQNINTDELNRAIYSYDASMIKAKPYGVIHIKKIEDISKVLKILYKYRIPYTPRLAGTNLTGGATNSKGGFVINLASLNKIHQIDTINNIAVVEPGVVNQQLQNELKKFGYFYAPDPASQKVSTIGGNIAENAGGPKCLKYGVTSNNVVKLEVVLPDGSEHSYSIYDKGPQLMNLFLQSEGTLGIVKKAYLKIIPLPKYEMTVYAEFKDLNQSVKSVNEIISKGIIPQSLEIVDKLTIDIVKEQTPDIKISPDTQALLLIDLSSNSESEILYEKKEIITILNGNSATEIKYTDNHNEREHLWKIRKEGYPSLARISTNILVEDGAVPRPKLIEAVTRIKEILSKYELKAGLLFHAGDGNIHPNIIFDERDKKLTAKVRKASHEILKTYIELGGTVSAEHGVGVEKRAALLWQYDKETINLFKSIKNKIDPYSISNPDKKLPVRTDLNKIKRPELPLSDNAKLLIKEIKEKYDRKTKTYITTCQTKIKEKTGDCYIIRLNYLNKVLDFDKENLTITVESGITIKEFKNFLISQNFDIDIPDISGSLAGMIAANSYIPVRDLLLSMDIILPDSTLIRLGGKNVKDVSGYDLIKMMIGSMGTLGIILSVTLKIKKYKKPNEKQSYVLPELLPNKTPLHRKIKEVFDPLNLFNPFYYKELYE